MKQSDGMVSISSEDDHCFVECVCETDWEHEQLSIGGAWVIRCPKCNRGYRTEFVLWVYSPDEKDPVYLDKDEWDEQVETRRKILEERKKSLEGRVDE